jgi:hypothetical protein
MKGHVKNKLQLWQLAKDCMTFSVSDLEFSNSFSEVDALIAGTALDAKP